MHLTYRADLSAIKPAEAIGAMEGLRDVIERRVNAFGVGEPLVQVEKSYRRRPETDSRASGRYQCHEAIKMIGETPFLEFRTESPNVEKLTEEEKKDSSKVFVQSDLTGSVFEKGYP